MPVAEYDTVTEARKGFKSMLDVAQDGGTGLVHRDGRTFALVSTELLHPALLAAVGVTPEVFFEDGGVGIALPGAPFAAEGENLQEAAADLVEALREYAEDWAGLRNVPNHNRLQHLVALVDVSSDQQLMDWLTGESAA
ncbi:hypothetical protein BJY21_002024 [Kineosphaera limosa]|nr:hypothetical protein [Kineosphaera limosa]NYE00840.1 hypothetical protein [Kineosphaera limosa]